MANGAMGEELQLVVVESPYAGDTEKNVEYARRAIRDCLDRGEAPIASHLLYTQEGIYVDAKPDERRKGMAAGLAWVPRSDYTVVYVDRGVTDGMKVGIAHAIHFGKPIKFRSIEKDTEAPDPAVYRKLLEECSRLAKTIENYRDRRG